MKVVRECQITVLLNYLTFFMQYEVLIIQNIVLLIDIGIYCGEDFFFTLPSSPQFCLSLKKGLFYLGCTTYSDL